MKNNILIIDIETTGFLKEGGKIVELGFVALDIETGERTKVLDEVVWEPGIKREEVESSWIVANSTLTTQMVQKGLRLDRIQRMVQSLIMCFPLGATAFNSAFDFDFLEDRGFRFPKKLDCPMLLAADLLKIPSTYKKGEYKWPKVTECMEHFFPEEDYQEEHRGFSDAMDEARIVFELIQKGIFKV